ncbi:MAG: hypothetical protein PHG06_20475 [Parabacteroides sp.]|nr:hypothetical protein [Parabacteroides sp.]
MRKFIFCIVMLVVLSSIPVFAENTPVKHDPSAGLMIVDALLVRPTCLTGAIISSATFVAIAIPVHLLGYSTRLSKAMVYAPWRFTSYRNLGEFGTYKDGKNMIGGEWEESESRNTSAPIDKSNQYGNIKGIVLNSEEIIEGQIIDMNADKVKIRIRNGKVMSYSFIKEVKEFLYQ